MAISAVDESHASVVATYARTAELTQAALSALGQAAGALQLPVVVSPPLARAAHATSNALAEVGAEFGYLTSADISGRNASTGRNPRALASTWRARDRIVGIRAGRRLLFPAFQFTEQAQPRPAVGAVVRVLRAAGWDDQDILLWWTAPTGWLGDRRPVDVLLEGGQADLLLDAARNKASEDW